MRQANFTITVKQNGCHERSGITDRVHSSMQIDEKTADRPSIGSTITKSKPQANSCVHRFSSFNELAPHRESWNRLVEEVGGDLFGSFEWCST